MFTDPSFTAIATGYPTPTVQWQISTDGGNTWTDTGGVLGSSSNSAEPNLIKLGTTAINFSGFQYRAIASNSAGPPSISAPATLVVGISSNYLSWMNNSFDTAQLGSPALSGLMSTPAGDGIPNLVKYALGLPPLRSDQDLLPLVISSNGTLSLSFSAAQTDVTYTAQVSPDLVNWTTTGVNVQMNGTVETATYRLPNNPGPNFMNVQISIPSSGRRQISPPPAGG